MNQPQPPTITTTCAPGGLLFLLLLALKLTNWAPGLDWFWVWAALWGPPVLVILLALLAFGIAALVVWLKDLRAARR
ncbi:membrane protein [Arthrobacter phage Mufasa8]|uniref:Membrane protein n=1 Tax=Arthrobacter phage Mufasa8 TaxID=2656526 RepID=A0A649VM76_9CAUD|nr:membrane protein [Arthrobacter phage Mufasa8]QGJ93530.1 membrane protein [Arthrobacter phage Mufasa8]